jgi:hypothetical protein
MAKFIDHHSKLPQMSPEDTRAIQESLRAGKKDEYGVRVLNLYSATDGQAWCITEAETADAVRKSHDAKGLHVDRQDIIEVKSAL